MTSDSLRPNRCMYCSISENFSDNLGQLAILLNNSISFNRNFPYPPISSSSLQLEMLRRWSETQPYLLQLIDCWETFALHVHSRIFPFSHRFIFLLFHDQINKIRYSFINPTTGKSPNVELLTIILTWLIIIMLFPLWHGYGIWSCLFWSKYYRGTAGELCICHDWVLQPFSITQ